MKLMIVLNAIMIAVVLALAGCSANQLRTCANTCRWGSMERFQDENLACVCANVGEWK